MSCNLSPSLPWPALLRARQLLAAPDVGIAFVKRGEWQCQVSTDLSWQDAEQVLMVDEDPERRAQAAQARGAVSFYQTDLHGLPRIESPNDAELESSMASAARVYLPVLLGAVQAKAEGRSFVVGHLTQTLDGRIACENGQSQWIGNQEDLHHSHRMRALLEGVMVGATTAIYDDPQLNVRHVTGPNPRRIVISGRGRLLQSPSSLKLLQDPGCEVLAGGGSRGDWVDAESDAAKVVIHDMESDNGRIQPQDVLAKMRQRDVHSVYLEGGAGTLSSFLQAGCIDLLQVHIAAMVLGSGLSGLTLPAVDHVDQGQKLHIDHVMLNGHVLLTCVPHT